MSVRKQIRDRILLTGSTGTLGFHILDQLQKRPLTEILAVHRRADPHEIRHPRVRHHVIEFSRQKEWATLFNGFNPTCIIHCAADGMIFPQTNWFKLVRFNVDFSLYLFELAARLKSCHFLHISTGLAYRSTGKPLVESDAIDSLHPYGASKSAADLLLRSAAAEFGTPLTVLRPFSFTGVQDNRTRLFPSLLRAAAEKRPLGLSPCNQVRDFCSARDIARAVLIALSRPGPNTSAPIYNLGSGQSIKLSRIIEEIVDELKIPVELKFGDRVYGPFEPMHLVADLTHARTELDWQPRHRLAHAVWQLAKVSFPDLKLKKPPEHL